MAPRPKIPQRPRGMTAVQADSAQASMERSAEDIANNPAGINPVLPKFSNPIAQVGQFFARRSALKAAQSEEMQNNIAALHGEANYYNNSPSKTKGILALRGGRARA